jgi:hypothetical protein
MPFIISHRVLMPGLAAAAGMVVLPLLHAQGVGTAQVGVPRGGVPRFGHDKEVSCTQRAHERVKALMAGLPWTGFDVRPSARNRPCK